MKYKIPLSKQSIKLLDLEENGDSNSLIHANKPLLNTSIDKVLVEQEVKIGLKLNEIIQQQQNIEVINKVGFSGLANQNRELIESNKLLRLQLTVIQDELDVVRVERERQKLTKNKRSKRRRLPKRDPITEPVYKLLIKEAAGCSFISARTRVGLCLLNITGVRVSELLNIRVFDLKTLIKQGYIGIDRVKTGPANHRAYLSTQGKRILKQREKDFQLLFLMKADSDFLFTSEKLHTHPIRRETITLNINCILKTVSEKLPDKPNLSSHSFRIGYITCLWKQTSDIEFVRQVIGHKNSSTTSLYIQDITGDDRKKIIDLL
jgi:site-specific recombinase XerD